MKQLSNLQVRQAALSPEGYFSTPVMSWINTVLVPAVQDRTPATIAGPYANDAAAAAGGVALGGLYYDAGGVPHVRIV